LGYDGTMSKNVNSVIRGYSRQKEEEQARLVATENKLPYINLVNYPFTGDVLGLIPPTQAKQFGIIAFQRLGNSIRVATPAPFTPGLAEFMSKLGTERNIRFEPYYCSETSINFALKQYDKLVREVTVTSARAKKQTVGEFLTRVKSLNDLSGAIANISTTELFELILSGAMAFDATDIHFEPQADSVRVRLRIDGELQDVAEIGHDNYRLLLSRVKNLSKLKLNRMATPQDGRFSITLEVGSVDVRVSILPASYGETAELRLLTGKGLMTLEQLGLNDGTIGAIKQAISKETGLVIVTGPTGAGKTTTLYAVLAMLNTPDQKIVTIEDPVEYKIPGIEQIQVDPGRGFDFADALRAVLRQDPDVILVGEIRDKETAEIAINAALTGHLVLTTLHANSAPATFARLLELGAPNNLLADAVSLVIAQRLYKKTCPPGVISCGRTAASEFLLPDEEFSQLIKAKATIGEFQQLYAKKGYKNLASDLQEKVAAGLINQN
jgi:MSHA biogenesis protein MshE